MTPETEAPRLSLPRKLGFAGFTVLLIFSLAELVLGLAGLKPGAQTRDPYVGFVAGVPLYEPVTGADGETELVTSPRKRTLFNEQSFPMRKGPGTYRIFCLGGSTTYGRPYDDRTSFAGWLRSYLDALDPGRDWEVINAGGISYASYRVALLMEELVEYEPDLFIIYTGQNEFLERRTYAGIQDIPAWIRKVNLLLGHTRVFTALENAISGSRSSRTAKSNEGATLLPAEVKTILDGSVGPTDYVRDDELRNDIVEHYRFNLERMIEIARRAGAGVMFVRPASNLGHCAPFKSEFSSGLSESVREQWSRLMEQARHADDPAQALVMVEQALALDPRRADSHYLHGEILRVRGDNLAAAAAFSRALNEDVCSLRAPDEVLDALGQVCATREVPLVDYESLVERGSPGGIPGEEIFLDHVHPTIEGNRILGEALFGELVDQGIATPSDTWGPEVQNMVEIRLLAGIDQKEHAAALRNLSKVLHWAGKFEEAEALALRALDLDPEDPAALLQLGLARKQEGRFEEAELLFLRAIAIEPRAGELHGALGSLFLVDGRPAEARTALIEAVTLRPDDPTILNNFGLALLLTGDAELALAEFGRVHEIDPTDARSWNNQGSAELELRRFGAAVTSYSRALELVPEYVAAHYGLAVALGQTGEDEKATRSLERVIELDRDHVRAHYALGTLHRRNDRTAQAIKEFEQVLRLDPSHPQAGKYLAELRGD
jgi:tetratricopeptide (TPR) repeat protein